MKVDEKRRPVHPCMRLSVLHQAWLLGLMFLAGLSGCGSASPGDPANVESHAAKAGPSPSAQAPVSGNATTTLAASPVPLASGLAPAGHGEARQAETLVDPAWMAKQLDSPDVQVRLRALDRWGQQAPSESMESVDVLLLALEDEDERVQARALALIEQDEQDWVRAQAAEK
jgi:hypothetical protein